MSVSFDELVVGLDARPSGNQWSARCPAHDDRSPSLSVAQRDGRLLIYCHAGCDFRAIIDALEQRGLWPVASDQPPAPSAFAGAAAQAAALYQRLCKLDAELQLLEHTRADRYLLSRGITVRPPQDLAYHPSLYHGWTRTSWPALVAAVRNIAGQWVGLHRTWLTFAEPISKAPIDPPRATLGPMSGHACHLSPPAARMLIGEGIETVLSAMQLYDLPGWAALTATNLPTIILPPIVRSVIVLADDDPAGLHGAIAAAQRFRREGRQAAIIKPQGANDFNDLLRGEQNE